MTLDLIPRSWPDSVLDSVVRLASRRGTDVVDRQDLIAEELARIVEETRSRGATPAQTLSRVLQDLRDANKLEFLGGGKYRLLKRPFDIETAEFSDEQIDIAIRERLLRLGQVATGDAATEARRRRGQDRLRVLTLENYRGFCAVCDVADRELLIAGHIVPWHASPDARGDLANLVCLCRFHDALFELGYWSLEDDLAVLCRRPVSSHTLRALLPDTIHFRGPVAYSPNVMYLRHHRLIHGFESTGINV